MDDGIHDRAQFPGAPHLVMLWQECAITAHS
jgi:hypothetical protein